MKCCFLFGVSFIRASLKVQKTFPVGATLLSPPWRVLVHWPQCALKRGAPLAKMSLCLLCSRLPLDQIVWTRFTPTCAKATDSPLLPVDQQVIKPVPSVGVPAELWLEFPGFQVAGLPVLARVLLEICVVGATCLHQPGPDDVGTAERIQRSSDTPSALHQPPWPRHRWSCLKVIV